MESLVVIRREATLPQLLTPVGILAAVCRHTLHTDKSGLDVEPPSEGRVRAGGNTRQLFELVFLQEAPQENQALDVHKRCTAAVTMATIPSHPAIQWQN